MRYKNQSDLMLKYCKFTPRIDGSVIKSKDVVFSETRLPKSKYNDGTNFTVERNIGKRKSKFYSPREKYLQHELGSFLPLKTTQNFNTNQPDKFKYTKFCRDPIFKDFEQRNERHFSPILNRTQRNFNSPQLKLDLLPSQKQLKPESPRKRKLYIPRKNRQEIKEGIMMMLKKFY